MRLEITLAVRLPIKTDPFIAANNPPAPVNDGYVPPEPTVTVPLKVEIMVTDCCADGVPLHPPVMV